MAATDARPLPQKNVAYRVTFPIFDADGDLVTGATGLDSEVSKDGATFADCTNEATEIAAGSGMYYLDLTSTEMNADTVSVIVKTTSSGAKTTPIVLYPEEAGDIRVNLTQLGSDSQSLADLKDFADDGYDPSTNKVAGVVLTDTVTTYTGNTPQTGDSFARLGAPAGASVSADVAGVQSDTNDIQTRIPAALTGDGNIKADTLRVGGTLQTAGDIIGDTNDIQGRLPAALTGDGNIKADTLRVGGTLQTAGDVIGDTNDIQSRLPAALVSGRIDASVGAIAAAAITAASIATDAIDADALAADAVAEIQSGLATAAALATVQSDTDNIQTRIPAALVSGRIDASVGAMASGVVTAAAIATDAIDADAISADAVTEIQGGLSTLTAAGVRTAVGLGSANLDTQLDALPTNAELATALTGMSTLTQANVRTALGMASANLDTQLTAIDDLIDTEIASIIASLAALNNLSQAQVLTQVNAALDTAMAELSQGVPSATPTLRTATMLLYMALRNKLETDATEKRIYNDAGVCITKKTLADSGTVYSETEALTGP